jgi:hypothetical protein
MAAGHDRRPVRVAAAALREDVADPVEPHGTSGLLAPADEEAARLSIEIAGGEPADAALWRRADPRQFHQARPQPPAIGSKIPHLPSQPQRRPPAQKPSSTMILFKRLLQLQGLFLKLFSDFQKPLFDFPVEDVPGQTATSRRLLAVVFWRH